MRPERRAACLFKGVRSEIPSVEEGKQLIPGVGQEKLQDKPEVSSWPLKEKANKNKNKKHKLIKSTKRSSELVELSFAIVDSDLI